jgi:membrane protein
MIAREWVLIKETVSGFIEHQNFTRGAAIAYYTIFSIAPLLIIVIAIASFVFGHDGLRARLSDN